MAWFMVKSGFFAIFVFVVFVSIAFFVSADDEAVFSTQQANAKRLQALNCAEQCITEGEIEYLRTEGGKGDYTYIYDYSFKVEDREYHNTVHVFKYSFEGQKYLPSAAGFTLNKKFPEKIMFDPNNPSINLPSDYVPVILEQKSPRGDLFWMMLVIITISVGYALFKTKVLGKNSHS